ncbi:hypothetical protein PGTUg99_035152 [Puccinia graminis f. sp. tritici]|uniref:Hydrophobin n=1 Tax=Puccinia graminis f. sp. tritici TaxID=56615 RepID=A0A5B0N4T7_PUCGR|nr:hypothetical protein PGTUg99_035152 [Puccinia graminis f. sp. tritici]
MHVIKAIFILLTLKFALISACDKSKFRHACGRDLYGVNAKIQATDNACGRGLASFCCDKTQLGLGEVKTGTAVAAVPCRPQSK